MQRYLMLTALHVLEYCEDIKQTYTQILAALQFRYDELHINSLLILFYIILYLVLTCFSVQQIVCNTTSRLMEETPVSW